MRLLLTTDTVGGVWTYSRELVSGLLTHADVTIHLVSLGRQPSPDQKKWLEQTIAATGRFSFTVVQVPLEWQQENAGAYDYGRTVLLDAVRDFQPDVFHSNQFCFGALDLSIPKIVVAHSDVLSWHRAVRGGDPDASPWLERYKALVHAGAAGADVLVAPTSVALQDFERGFGAVKRGVVIPNGRDMKRPRGHRRLQAVTSGRVWDAAKGTAVLEEMYSPMPVLIAGETQHSDASYDASRLRHSVLLGQLAEGAMAALLSESAVYLATSVYEPFGLGPVEAALCGCAVIARDIPSLREVWGDDAAYFHDALDLVMTLQRLAVDKSALAAAQRSARRRAKKLYSREAMTDAYLRLYREVISGKPALQTEATHA